MLKCYKVSVLHYLMLSRDHIHLILQDSRGRRLKSEVGGPAAAGARQVFDPGGSGLNLPPSLPLPTSSPSLLPFAPSFPPETLPPTPT